VLPKVLALLRQDGVGKAGIAQDLHLAESELDQLMFGLVLTGLRGGKAAESTTATGNVPLTLVD
jgi:hypothetical protein